METVCGISLIVGSVAIVSLVVGVPLWLLSYVFSGRALRTAARQCARGWSEGFDAEPPLLPIMPVTPHVTRVTQTTTHHNS